MQRLGDRLVYSASDLNAYVECVHLVELNRRTAFGEFVRPAADAGSKLIAEKGELHERRYLEEMNARYGSALVRLDDRFENSISGMLAAQARTLAAMDAGAPLIYQATFFDGTFYGRADFLKRVETASARLPWSYEVIDTKLALSPKPYFLIQLCNYSEHVARLLGSAPASASIVLGSGIERAFRIADYAAYYRRLKASFLGEAATIAQTYPLACRHCTVCAWNDRCEARRDRDDHLSIVAFMRADQIEKFEACGIATVAALATASDDDRPKAMSPESFDYLRAQAAEQHKGRLAAAAGAAYPYSYAFRKNQDTTGFAKLPSPAAGDVFFDIEGDPLFRPDRNLDYLFGFYLADERRYEAFWATDFAQERDTFARVIDFIVERRKRYPSMRVYHYAAYEKTSFARLMGRYRLREREVDDLFRNDVLVDLYPLVRQALWVSQPSYGLKKLEKFYNLRRDTETLGGEDSIVMFESWLESGDRAILEDIRRYNEDDCVSTHGLREWLLARRAECEVQLGAALPWPAYDPAANPAPVEEAARTDLEAELLAGVPDFASLAELRAAPGDLRARWILGNVVQYHRRDRRPSWMEYFLRLKHPEDLQDGDRCALAGLTLCEDVAPYKLSERAKSFVYTYSFPEQEHYLGTDQPWWPFEEFARAGDVVAIDDRRRRIAIRLVAARDPASLRALIPAPDGLPLIDKEARLAELARLQLRGELAATFPATLDLLLANPPRFRDRPPLAKVQPGEVTAAAISERIAALDRSVLFIQGPPGTGKSTKGAAAIVDLLAAGKRVGLAAHSHSALHNLLAKVEETAEKRGVRFRGVHKSTSNTPGSAFRSQLAQPMVTSSADMAAIVADAPQLLSGTEFAWASPHLGSPFDYVFIDEAGQVSIADALIVSRGASNVVLLGDPLQLAQVAKGSHPTGCELSILEHLLGPAKTVPEDRGIFLDVSYRMHPEICTFISNGVYEGRLASGPQTIANAVASPGLSGSGLAYMPVVHSGNSRAAAAEVEAIADAILALLDGGTCTIGDAPARPLRQSDILVVSPYNMQRTKISQRLLDAGLADVRVGTVNKFQGLEAPVVLYSMATSSGQDLPRDVAFLFETNRMNVAISRAQCLSVLVCSPELLRTPCNTPAEMTLVNLLCAFVEDAQSFPARHSTLAIAP
jgi:uncharacterized protein